MGFILRKREVEDVDIAREIMETFLSHKKVRNAKAKKIIRDCQGDKEKVLVTAAKLIPNPSTNKELFVVSSIYTLLGKKYQKQAISYLEQYCKVGAYFEDTPSEIIEIAGQKVSQRDANVSSVYVCLGKLYEQRKEYNQAMKQYLKGLSIFNGSAANYINVMRMYHKQKDFLKVKKIFQEAKDTVYYQHDPIFKSILDDSKASFTL